MSIYCWTLGEVALAKVCKKVYAKVKVVKNEDGIFYDYKVLGISTKEDGSLDVTKELCYYVETIRTEEKLWLPYTSLHLAARGRPFYGSNRKVSPPSKPQTTPKKRKIKEDHTLPMNVKLPHNKEPDLNTTYDIRHMPLKQGKYENAFKEFVRRSKEMLFDEYYANMDKDNKENNDTLYYLKNVNASTEDKFEAVIKNIASEKEIENYLHQCWRYNFLSKQKDNKDNNDETNNSNSTSPQKPAAPHVAWCLVCGAGERLRRCARCPSAFHLACRKEWLLTIKHRKNPPKKTPRPAPLVQKILSSTRTICSARPARENMDVCPSCMWGPRVGYEDVVWHKLGACAWWPARVLAPGAVPACLLARAHPPAHWPLRYYGTLNYSWGDASRMCLFLPSHTSVLDAPSNPEGMLKQAVMEACDDYISVYLT